MQRIEVGQKVYDKVTNSVCRIESGTNTSYDNGIFQFQIEGEPFIRHIRVDEAYERFTPITSEGAIEGVLPRGLDSSRQDTSLLITRSTNSTN